MICHISQKFIFSFYLSPDIEWRLGRVGSGRVFTRVSLLRSYISISGYDILKTLRHTEVSKWWIAQVRERKKINED